MKHRIVFLFLITTVCISEIAGQSTTNGSNAWYLSQFKKADSLNLEGLPRDAEPIYNLIFNRSRAEKNYTMQLKTIDDRMVNKCYFEEKALVKVIQQLKADIHTLEFPVNQVGHSILGNLYWQYYQQNRWRIHQRTNLSGDAGDDIETWDLKRIVQEVIHEFNLSLENPDRLYNTPVNIFDEILSGEREERKLRPTLLDLLAHRALNIYTNYEVALTSPIDPFMITNPVYFNLGEDFSSYIISSADTMSLNLRATKLYQELVQFHLDDTDDQALIDLELNRLKFIHAKSTHPRKDTLYREALVKLSDVTKNKEIKLEVLYRLANFIYSLESGGKTNYYSQTLDLCNLVLDKFPSNNWDRYFNSIIDKVNEPRLTLQSERVVQPDKPSLVKLAYKNIDTAYFKLYRVNMDWVSQTGEDNFNRSNIDTFKKKKVIKEWKQFLPEQGDFREHSVEVPVSELEKGFYVLVVSDKEELNYTSNTVATVINVTNLFVLNRPTKEKKALFTVTDRASGIPQANISLELFYYKYDYSSRKSWRQSMGKIITNKEGVAVYKGELSSYSIIASHKGDTLFIPSTYYRQQYSMNSQSIRTILFTDRGIYRPGQTVHFKGLILECSGEECKILPNRDEEVVLYDPNYQDLSELKVKSNEFGTFSGSFTIPTGLLNGNFNLECNYGEKQIRVEEYKRPTFEVTYKPVQKTYSFNDSIVISGLAKAYAGYPIDNAKISYRVNRKVESRWSWYWQWRNTEDRQVVVGSSLTDKEGNFTISYFTDDSDIEDKDLIYAYTLFVDITDANGETRSAKHTLRVSKSPLMIKTEFPEVIFTNSVPELKVQTNNINGGDVNSDISISIVKLKAPNKILFDRAWEVPDVFITDEASFRNDFPNRVYKTETNPDTWEEGSIVFKEQYNTSKNSPDFRNAFSSLKQAYYKVKIAAKDSNNQEATWQKVVRIIQEKPQMPQCTKDWVTSVKTSGEPGEVAEFWVASLTPNTPIRYELLHGDVIVETKTIVAGKAVKKIQIPIEEKHRGGFAVQFVQVAEGQAFTSLKEVKVPYSNKKLDISFISFRNKLLPGEQEQWKLSIKNNWGEKETAEMMATLYDASLDVFAPLSWETNFLNYKNHNWHKWKTNLVPRISYPQQLASINLSIWGWSKSYEHLNLSYNYYGGYNYHFNDLQYRLKKKAEERERNNKKTELEEKEKQKKLKEKETLEKMISENDSLLLLMKIEKAKLISKTGKLSGVIVSATNNEKLIGVNVAILNTSTGTVSDVDGNFTLEKLPKGIWIKASFIGFKTQYVQVLSDSITIMLEEEIAELEEVIVMDFANQKKEHVTAAVSEVKSDKLLSNIVEGAPKEKVKEEPIEEIATRKNFNETAFFYPNLVTNDNGEVTIDFTIPEALTRWKMMGFAHTKDFKTGTIRNTLITQKDVAIMVNAPRFLRENDTIEFAAKISNLSESDISGHALIQLFDAITNKPIDSELLKSDAKVPFSIEKGLSKGIRWNLVIPSGIQAVNYKVMAKAGQHTDGEEAILPVLVNSKLVTESMPFMLRPQETSEYRFDRMVDQKSTTLRNEAYTIEFTSNPAWYAIQAMPYLMEFPYECSEQVFSRFFANSLSTTIMNSSPRIQEVFNTWKATKSESLISNLEKNQELKELLIQETPWLRNATNETERKKRLALLFDLNHMSNNINSAFQKLQNKQTPNGGFAWFDGMRDNRYITQHIVTGLAQLQHLGAIQPNTKSEVDQMVNKAMNYQDARIIEDYKRLLELERKGVIDMKDDHISWLQIHYLYSKSFYAPVKPDENLKKAYDYFYNQAKTYWLLKGEYAQGMIAISLNRSGDTEISNKIIKSLSNRAIRSEELGMYWANNRLGYYWYQAPIETQAMLIEAFHEVAADTVSIEEMKIWLLRNKQTTDWKTTKATVAACYALILRGTDILSDTKILEVEIAGKQLESIKDIAADAGTGYVKTTFKRDEIQAEMGEIKVHNPNNGVAWGAAYWQYFEQLDKITAAETNLKIDKKLFVKEYGNTGASLNEITSDSPINVGDEVVVRIEIRADRDFEYIHLKDMRASGFEPISTVSQYKYRDGLGYYESVKDASENFFIDYMRKGVYVFEYSLRAVHAGFFSNGITTMQSMYAPEFSSHSQGIRIEIKE